jgi:sugar lactone lactonase YvrE
MTVTLPEPETVAAGFAMPEAPRWHEGAFYFSDVWAGRVHRLEDKGDLALIAEFPDDYASGLGFLPNGDLLTVLMQGRKVVRTAQGRAAPYADLQPLTRFIINDMIVRDGRAYVSQPGFDMWAEQIDPQTTDLILIGSDGQASIAASDMRSPNGMAVSPDGSTLFVAESSAGCITTFAIGADGALSDRQLFAQLPDGGIPDGICIDAAGGVWMGVPMTVAADGVHIGPGVQRIVAGGEVTHVVPIGGGRRALACVLGGDDRRSLFICTSNEFHPHAARTAKSGRVERIEVDFGGIGQP